MRIRSICVVLVSSVSLLGVGASRVGAVGGPTLSSVKPSSGHVGTVVTLSGGGFVAGDVVSFNGVPTPASAVSADGTQLTVSVPLEATTGPITVSDPTGGQSSGPSRRPFRVTLGLAALVGDYRGAVVSLRGSGFPPDQTLPVVLDRSQVGTAVADAAGAFDASVTVPWTVKPGKHRLGALVGIRRVTTVLDVFGDWPQAAHDAASSSDQTYEPSLTPATVAGLEPRTLQQPWQLLCLPPLIAGGILVRSCGDSLTASDAVTNAPLWKDQVGWVYSQAAIDHGVVYVGVTDSDNGVYGVAALDLHSGTQDWATQLNQPVVQVIASGAAVYASLGVTSFGGEVVALDAGSGQQQWSQSFSGSGYANAFDRARPVGGLRRVHRRQRRRARRRERRGELDDDGARRRRAAGYGRNPRVRRRRLDGLRVARIDRQAGVVVDGPVGIGRTAGRRQRCRVRGYDEQLRGAQSVVRSAGLVEPEGRYAIHEADAGRGRRRAVRRVRDSLCHRQ